MHRRILVLVAVLGPAAGVCADDRAKTHDLHTWRVTWKAGDTATVRSEASSTSGQEITQAGGKPAQKVVQTTRQAFTYVQRCLAADASGRATRFLVHVREWSLEQATTVAGERKASEPDVSVQGLHLEVTVPNGPPAYRVLTPGAAPSAQGLLWLDTSFGSKQRGTWLVDLDQQGRPPGPVKVGDTWPGDPKKIDFPLPLDAAASSTKVTLEDVSGGRVRFGVASRFKVTGLPLGSGPGAPMAPFGEGGVHEGQATFTHSLAPHTFDLEGTNVGRLAGTASIPGVLSVVLSVESRRSLTSRTGGEMPPPPAEKPVPTK